MPLLNKRPTHTWLKPLFDILDGNGIQQPRIGSATGTIGLYGATGIAGRIATGTAAAAGITGTSGNLWYNGGSGNFYTPNDVVLALKNCGILKP